MIHERFFPADNPLLTKSKYLKALQHTPEHKRGVRILGRFDIEDSRVIPEFDPRRHVIEDEEAARLVATMKPQSYACMDVGLDHPTVFLLACTLADGRVLVYDEYSARHTRVEHDSPHILAKLGDKKLEAGFVAIDPSADNITKGNPISVMEMYIEHGVPCFQAIRTQIAGEVRQIHEIREMFAHNSLIIANRCKLLQRNLRLYKLKRDRHNQPMSQKGSPYVDKDNDAIDCLRYLLTQVWYDLGFFNPSKATA